MTREESQKLFNAKMDELVRPYIEREMELRAQIMSLTLEIDTLKQETDKVWKAALDLVAEERVKNRLKELSSSSRETSVL